jgi:hypothetical protein
MSIQVIKYGYQYIECEIRVNIYDLVMGPNHGGGHYGLCDNPIHTHPVESTDF